MLLGHTPALRHLNVRTFRPMLVRNGTVRLRPLIYTTCGTSFSNSRVTIRMPLALRTRLRTHTLVVSAGGVLSPTGNRPVVIPSRSIMLNLCCVAHSYIGTGNRNVILANPGRTRHLCHSNLTSLRTHIGIHVARCRGSTGNRLMTGADLGSAAINHTVL